MAFDEDLADRVRELLDGDDVTEQRMFGGLAFLVAGNMAVAASGHGGLMVRVDPERSEALAAGAPSARPMEMRGRPITGWLRVDADDLRTKRQLGRWVRIGVSFASSLPAKPASRRRR
jgi:TfoX/Sxy family transcriptional regulator of competence genes